MIRVGYLFVIVLLVANATTGRADDAANRAFSLPLGPHLFIDDYLIASQSGLQRRLEHPARLPEPVVTGPEDKNFQPYVAVIRDPQTKRFRMWYGVPAIPEQASPSHLAYIESADGIHFDRPHRVLNDPSGIVVRFGASVIDEGPHFPDHSKRYKFGWNFEDAIALNGLMIATSPDGFDWTAITSKPPVLVHTHDINNIYRDPIRKHYIATVNMLVPEPGWTEKQGAKGKRRRTFQSTSDDLIHFTVPHEVVPPDALDEGEFQYYGMSGYLARGQLLIGLVKVLRDDLPAEPGGEVRGIGYTALAWSRDGLNWERDREPFLDRNPTAGTWDRAMTWIDCQVPVGSETFLYYGGYKRGHKIERFTERQIGLARMPRDRYVARVAGKEAGMLTTPLAVLEGKSITVNADIKGELRVRALDARGEPVQGFDFDDCEPITSDVLQAPIRWKRSIDELNQQPVSLQFQLRDGSIYGFEMSADSDLEKQSFDAKPDWEGHHNRLVPDRAPITRQDFGYSATRHAGGEAGEIGGWINRSSTPASYTKAIAPKTFNDKLSASGKFSVTANKGGSGALFGWFNENSRGWRTPNSLAFRLDGNGDNYWVFFEYGTQNRQTGGSDTFEGDRYQTTKTKPFPADGTVHEWSLTYDPDAAKGLGEITFVLDGQSYVIVLKEGHKADGVIFNRFGIMNVQTTGDGIEAFFDDLVIDGDKHAFSSDPNWEARGNRIEFADRVRRPWHDFGYAETTHAGGDKPGEIGGVIWRGGEAASYADKVGPFNLEDPLHASGTIAFTAGTSDSGTYIGFFNAESHRAPRGETEHAPNMLAIAIEGPSRVGHYFRPGYRDGRAEGGFKNIGPVIQPDGKKHTWSLDYDPRGADGNGRITARLDDHVQEMDLKPGTKKAEAAFDRFGLFNMNRGGSFVEVWLDDLKYTARKTRAAN